MIHSLDILKDYNRNKNKHYDGKIYEIFTTI